MCVLCARIKELADRLLHSCWGDVLNVTHGCVQQKMLSRFLGWHLTLSSQGPTRAAADGICNSSPFCCWYGTTRSAANVYSGTTAPSGCSSSRQHVSVFGHHGVPYAAGAAAAAWGHHYATAAAINLGAVPMLAGIVQQQQSLPCVQGMRPRRCHGTRLQRGFSSRGDALGAAEAMLLNEQPGTAQECLPVSATASSAAASTADRSGSSSMRRKSRREQQAQNMAGPSTDSSSSTCAAQDDDKADCAKVPCSSKRAKKQQQKTPQETSSAAIRSQRPVHEAAQQSQPDVVQQPIQQRQQMQQVHADRVLLLGIDPDSSGAVAVVEAALLPCLPDSHNSNTHSSKCSGQQEEPRQQQQQYVDLRNATVCVYDMPVQQIPLRKKTKASPQRYRKRLDIVTAIALIKQLIQQHQQPSHESTDTQDGSSIDGSSNHSSSCSSDNSKVLMRAYLEMSSITPTNGSLAILNQGYSAGAWQAVLLALGVEVSTVHVKSWKKDMGLLKQDKDSSRQLAVQLYSAAEQPQGHIIGRRRDHGRAEALLIAAWGCGWRASQLDSSNSSSSDTSDSSSSSWSLQQGPLRAAVQMDGGMHLLSGNDLSDTDDNEFDSDAAAPALIMPAAAMPAKQPKALKQPKAVRRSKGKKDSTTVEPDQVELVQQARARKQEKARRTKQQADVSSTQAGTAAAESSVVDDSSSSRVPATGKSRKKGASAAQAVAASGGEQYAEGSSSTTSSSSSSAKARARGKRSKGQRSSSDAVAATAG